MVGSAVEGGRYGVKYAFISVFVLILNVTALGDGWDSAAVIVNRIHPPSFQNQSFTITNYGAVGNGTYDCTNAIKNAINDCNAAGGGRVVIPQGTFLTGAIYLKSNVNLYLSTGATLLFSSDKSKYLPVVYTRFEGIECMNYSPFIYAFNEINIAISGSGTLDGQANNSNWWDWKSLSVIDTTRLNLLANTNVPVEQRIFGNGYHLRPSFIQLYRCKNILIDSVKLLRSPMWNVHPVLSENVTVSNITVNTYGPNNDGCNPECCNDVLIKNCSFNTGDDCIAIKAGRNTDGRRVNVPSQNIVIKNCKFQDGHGGITVGSEMTGGVRNVFADSCTMNGVNFYNMLRMKTNSLRGGYIDNIWVRNVTEAQDTKGVIHIDMFYGEGDVGAFIPTVRNIYVQNVVSNKSPYAIYIKDYQQSPVQNMQLKDCVFKNVTNQNVLGNVVGLQLRNVSINGTIFNTAIGDDELSEANGYRLDQNYPNPFNPNTIIRYQLPRDEFAILIVSDILGRAVKILVNEFKARGSYSAAFNAEDLPSGIYFCTLRSGTFISTKKITYLK